ncbi:hypothetical protein CL644_00160 [bacterium]|nr:hypothetical protein [Parcubacteria group bacterium]MBF05112.1 hypothetical protein [bacterium]|tara:strand:+ start:4569 stop:5579 length:1011 start_codon:yes stop_codon:yes gene_type:complete
MKSFSKKEAFVAGWESFKERPFFIIGLFLITTIISIITGLIADEVSGVLVGAVINIADFAIQTVIGMGMTLILLRLYDRVETDYTDLLEPLHLFWKYLVASILVMIVILFGLILFIVPGIVAGVALLFTSYLIIDRDLGPVDAMKESLRITNGHRWNIVLFLLLATGLNILGALFFGIGLLVTIPVSALALVHIYRWLLDPPTETGIEVSLPVKIITVFAIAVIFIGTALLIFGIIRGFLNDSELRDAQRRTDVSYIKESADSYFDSYGTYPESVALLVPDFISYVPTDPITQVPYEYLLREAGNDFEVCTILENDEFGGIYCEFGVELGANAVDQ